MSDSGPAVSATGGSADTQAVDLKPGRWGTRRGTALAIRTLVVIGPAVISVVAARVAGGLLPRPDGVAATLGWWAAVIVAAAVTLAVVDRGARRLLPLAALYRLALVFPDKAPSRYRVALRAGTVHQLSEKLRAGESIGDTPAEAAENLLALVSSIGKHDRITRGHSERVRAYSDMIGEQLGLSVSDREKLHWSALVHDAGKITVRPEILNKPGRPTDEEWQELRDHPAASARLVEPLRPWLGEWVDAATQHHERVDGKGYPNGLAGDDISLAGRIVAVADAYDCMTSARSYKRPLPAEQARYELTRNSGTQFDADVVRAFLGISVGRLHLIAGPFAWLSQVPVLAPATTAVTAAGTTAAASMAAIVGMLAFQLPSDATPAPDSSEQAVAVEGARIGESIGADARPNDGRPGAPTTVAAVDADGRPVPTTTRDGTSGATNDGDSGGDGATVTTRGDSSATTTRGSNTSTTRSNTTTRSGANPTAPTTTIGGGGGGNPPPTTTTTTTTIATTTTTVNAAPIAQNDSANVVILAPPPIYVLGNDYDTDGVLVPSTLRIVTGPSIGSASVVAGGYIRYSAPPLTINTTTVRYEVCDDDGACAQANLTISILTVL